MKNLFFLFLACTVLACSSGNKTESNALMADVGDMPAIKFEHTDFNFGEITEGDVVEHKFKFENVGQSPLIINSVVAGCGCTIPSWNKSPIKPNEKDEILVRFDSKGKEGVQRKFVKISSNAGETEVYFSAMVEPKKESK